jgi:rhodanese-related sulfurtransferase
MPDTPSISEISVKDFAQRWAASPSGLQLLDVREEQEIAIAALEGFQNVPLSQFQVWSNSLVAQLDPHAETYVLCHHGMRSAQMCQWLAQQGFTNLNNIAGGIDSYSSLVDPSVPRY